MPAPTAAATTDEESSALVGQPVSSGHGGGAAPRPSTARRLTAAAIFVALVVTLAALGSQSSSSSSSDDAGSWDDDVDNGAGRFNDSLRYAGPDPDDDLDAFRNDNFTYVFNCSEVALQQLVPGTHAWQVRRADCGSGYVPSNSTALHKHMRIVLWGNGFDHGGMLELSGCPVGYACGPIHPMCFFERGYHAGQVKSADVVVISAYDAGDVLKVAPRRKTKVPGKLRPYRVLYWREAFWPTVSVGWQQHYDFEMGVHFFAGVTNPTMLRRPHQLLAKTMFNFLAFAERSGFALSIISDCQASSHRSNYVDHLSDWLGKDRVHQYGKCGTRSLPPPPITNAARTIEKYKFFFAFENSIQDGYVTEKLFTVLTMPVVPVYLGAFDVPNITLIPSFIKASDFATPKQLAEYLLHLDAHPDEYMRYHAWRNDPSGFHPGFLDLVAHQVPGQAEMRAYKGRGYQKFSRRAACCRLCDENRLEWAKANRKALVESTMHGHLIDHTLFAGKMSHRFASFFGLRARSHTIDAYIKAGAQGAA